MNLWRSWLTQTRDRVSVAVGVVMNTLLGLVFGVLYYGQIPVRGLSAVIFCGWLEGLQREGRRAQAQMHGDNYPTYHPHP